MISIKLGYQSARARTSSIVSSTTDKSFQHNQDLAPGNNINEKRNGSRNGKLTFDGKAQ